MISSSRAFSQARKTHHFSAPCPSAPDWAPDSSHAKHRAGRLGACCEHYYGEENMDLSFKNLKNNSVQVLSHADNMGYPWKTLEDFCFFLMR